MSTLLWAASLRHLLRRPAQLVLALAGLTLGVATITAVDLATHSARRAFELSSEAVRGSATHEILGGPTGVDERLLVSLGRLAPQLDFAPIIDGYVTTHGETLELIGIDPLSGGGPGDLLAGTSSERVDSLTRLSRFLAPQSVMLPSATAQRLGIAVGSTFMLEVAGRPYSARLTAELPVTAGGALLFTDIAQAQEWFGLVGRLTRIEIRAPQGAPAVQALERVRAALPPGTTLQPAGSRSRSSLDLTQAFTTNLQAMSLLGLLVGLFLIYSTLSFAVLQRRRTLAVLRALGATRAGVLGLVLTEAAVLGSAGAALGLATGVALGHGLVRLVAGTINDLYFVVEVSRITLSSGALVRAAGAGVLTALLAALLPALEAARVAPQLGVRRSVIEARTLSHARRLVAASAALALAAGAVVWTSERSVLAGFVGLFLLLLSVAALTPAWLRFCARAAARLSASASPVAALGLGDVAASLSRTGVAVAALGMALAAMIGVSVMVASFRESLRDWLYRTMRADLYISAPGPGFARPERRLDPEVVRALLAVPGVAHGSTGHVVVVESSAGPITLDAIGLTPETAESVPVVEPRGGAAWPEFERGAILVGEPLAWRLRLHAGSRLRLDTAHGPHEFSVAGVYREYGTGRGGALMNAAIYRRWWDDADVSTLALYLSPGVNAAQMVPRLHAAAHGRQALFVGSNVELRALSLEIFERTFVITRVLNWLTAGVAAVGLVSALLAWELERAHELAMLRAIGLTPRAAAVLIEAQTGFMGLVALTAAIPAGLLAAWLLVAVVNRRAFGWQIDFHLRPQQLLAALALALLAALAAGVYPAWRTARGAVAGALREE